MKKEGRKREFSWEKFFKPTWLKILLFIVFFFTLPVFVLLDKVFYSSLLSINIFDRTFVFFPPFIFMIFDELYKRNFVAIWKYAYIFEFIKIPLAYLFSSTLLFFFKKDKKTKIIIILLFILIICFSSFLFYLTYNHLRRIMLA